MVLMESERRVEDSTEEYSEEIKDLVIARLSALPSNIVISIGSAGTFSARDLVKKIRADDEVGKKIVEMQLSYLRSLKDLVTEEVE